MAEENDSQQEPSMEDILASIRRILSEDEQKESDAEDQQDTIVEPEPPSDSESAPETEMVNAAATQEIASVEMEEKSVQPTPRLETVPEEPATDIEEPEPSLMPESEISSEQAAEISASSIQSPATGPVFEDILELTEQMIAQPPSDAGAGAPILSGTAQVSSTDTLQELAKALLSRRDIAIGSREMTLEGLIREILRPLLREWLDENLPYLIERLVKKEIDHMVNRAERLDL